MSTPAASAPSADPFQALDDSRISRFQLKIMFVSGMGALEKASKEFLIDKISAIAPTPPVPLLPLVAEGDPAESLLAASKDADILVLGTRGRSHLAGLLLGSVSQICAAAARCPVVLVKREDDFADS
jgi:nucleotide-binding universal stress UspA family protein